jgi:hypothetical protein
MDTTQILFNKDRLIKFLFELKLNIDKRMMDETIQDSNDCMIFIKKEITSVNNNVFKFNGYESLNNLTEQVFYYYFGADEIETPLSNSVNGIASLN